MTEAPHQFWSTQPVLSGLSKDADGPINIDSYYDNASQEPLALPEGYAWSDLDVDDSHQLQELTTFLQGHYVEDRGSKYRLSYPAEFLTWALKPPGYKSSLHLGIRSITDKSLVGFISGIPFHMQVYAHQRNMIEINFLCVHKDIRQKRLAPLLIEEISRRISLMKTFQAIYTASVKLPGIVSICNYYERILDAFAHARAGRCSEEDAQEITNTLALPDEPQTVGLRLMKESDTPAVHSLLKKQLSACDMYPIFSEDDVRHWLMPLGDVVFTYVVEDRETGTVNSFMSFYNLSQRVIAGTSNMTLRTAYLYYHAAQDPETLPTLLHDILIVAKTRHGFEGLMAIDALDNLRLFKDLDFYSAQAPLYYYLYNWQCQPVESAKVGLIML